MITTLRRRTMAVAAAAALTFGLVACSDDATSTDTDAAGTGETTTVEIEDNFGTHTVNVPAEHVVATDNRVFRTLEDWGVELAAAPVALMPPNLDYKTDDSIVNLGNHREPDLEAVVAVEPDLIINGQRFQQYAEDFAKLAPDATIVDFTPREDKPFDEELRRQTTALGELFGKQEEADKLIEEFDKSIERAKAAYDSNDTVMGAITSGGNINYAAPGSGRSVGPAFDILGLTPALEVDNATTDHEGDDISVEAVADANPDILLVMDRDAAVAANKGEEYTPANELIANSAALKNVNAVKNDRIIYMPQFTYIDEGIQTYTEFFNSLADALEKK
ncbi:iron complex transport system substrate-binding protein [Corynebacterium freneyi]|uniref:Iron complex transport system substrate-binding protein n=2 Tax=Corynebacterium freneyi TaxID=134034 RepID=A0ABS4U8V4_9CORY|nr:ABC transporter substrate-binding protein [Corynebacterium freneyi]MBP2332633.1 iron complex transport system substrate-binding protein [Corynebacterium freneyi]WJZ05261.1 putative ABC transporter solute-binding protein YclQ precursor [Corynebacterium freneyi]